MRTDTVSSNLRYLWLQNAPLFYVPLTKKKISNKWSQNAFSTNFVLIDSDFLDIFRYRFLSYCIYIHPWESVSKILVKAILNLSLF